MSETVAKKLRIGIAEIRELRARTGSPSPPSIVIRSTDMRVARQQGFAEQD